jgi:hypothetical protein
MPIHPARLAVLLGLPNIAEIITLFVSSVQHQAPLESLDPTKG